MVVPFSNRAAVATLPALALAKGPATVKEVIDDLAKQCEPYRSVFECVQLVRGRTLRIHFPSADVMEDITSGGLTFRGHPLAFSTTSVFKWVSILDLPYGTPDGEISSVLSKHGQVVTIRSEVYNGLYTGTRVVKMTVKSAIPSRVTIAGHVCTVFYRGQVRSCFRCGASGHEAKKCPRKSSTQSDDPRPVVSHQVEPPEVLSQDMLTTPPSSPRSFSNVVSGKVPPTVIATPSPRPISPVTIPGSTNPPGMETDVPSTKRPYSPVSDSEWTDTDEGERTRPRLEEKLPESVVDIPVTTMDPPSTQYGHTSVTESEGTDSDETGRPRSRRDKKLPKVAEDPHRDRSPLRTNESGIDSSSDSSGKSPTFKAPVDVPPAVQPVVTVEPLCPPTRTLDRRLLSTRLKEYCPGAPEYSKEQTEEVISASLEIERLLEFGLETDRENTELLIAYDHLKLDYSVAISVYNSACDDDSVDDVRIEELNQIMDDSSVAITNFEAANPQLMDTREPFTPSDFSS